MNGPLGLPMAAHCELDPAYRFIADPDHPALARYAEISRLAVSKAFRRREGDSFFGTPPRRDRSQSGGVIAFYSPNDAPEIVSGIYRMFYQDSKRLGITHWVVAMERGLSLMLKRMALLFTPIGPETDYYGPVRPYVAEIAEIERHVSRNSPRDPALHDLRARARAAARALGPPPHGAPREQRLRRVSRHPRRPRGSGPAAGAQASRPAASRLRMRAISGTQEPQLVPAWRAAPTASTDPSPPSRTASTMVFKPT